MVAPFNPEEEQKAIFDLLQTLIQSIEKQDVATMRSLIWPKGRVIRSRDAQISWLDFGEFIDRFGSDQRKKSEILHDETYELLCIQPDFAVTWFASTLLVDDVPVSYIVNALSVHKRDGKWKFSILADSGVSLGPGQEHRLSTSSPAFRNETDEVAVRKVLSTFFDELANSNVDGMLSQVWAPEAGAAISRPHLAPQETLMFCRFSDIIQKWLPSAFPAIETFDDYELRVHENIAVAVGPFKTFKVNGPERIYRSHGWNMLALLKQDGVWKISGAADTSEMVI